MTDRRYDTFLTRREIAAFIGEDDRAIKGFESMQRAALEHAPADIAALDEAKQGKDDRLTALSGLNATPGLVEQTGAATFDKRPIGVAGATYVPTRADADARYVQQEVGADWAAPSGTVARTTFASYAGQDVSAAYVEAEVQAIDDHVKVLSQRLAALIEDLQANKALPTA